jgi:hypothetical protein
MIEWELSGGRSLWSFRSRSQLAGDYLDLENSSAHLSRRVRHMVGKSLGDRARVFRRDDCRERTGVVWRAVTAGRTWSAEGRRRG